MRKIRNTMPFLHALLLSALLLAGCVREEFPGAGSVAEGEPARIELNLIVPTMSSGSSTRALTPEQENKIENLRVMVFRADGSVVSNGKYVSSGSKFTIDSYSGSNYTLFFIANVSNAEIEAKLQSATSLPEVEEIVTTATQLDFGMNTTHPLMMTGKQENVTFAPGNSTYGTPIQLHFIAAKVTLIVIDKTPADQGVSIIGWDVENAPARSYLFPHTADVNVNLPGTSADKDDYWLTTDVDYPFEAEDKLNKTVSQTLYVFENRRGGRVNKSLPTNSADRYPGMSFNDKDDRGKGWFKPARATAIAIKAMHKTTFETKQVKAHIYLGADNHSDYNIERGKHYTFTVTVNGLNDIKVDSNVDYVLGELLVDHGDNLTMDAHPDFRPMRIHAPKGKVIMEILDNSGRAYNDPDAGLWILNEDGTPSNVRNKFVREREREYSLALYPGVSVSFQRLQGLTWGFGSRIVYDKDDRWGNGKFLTANIVYNDVKRVNNEAVNFGKASTSYRPMYSGEMGNFMTDVPIPPYSGGAAPPYYHPAMSSFRNELYHPIYRSSLGRYCHEKNRDINGDGIIEPAETYWYLPSRDELVLLYIGIGTFENPNRYVYASVTENKEWTTGNGIAVNLFYHHLLGSPDTGAINKITVASRVFCIRSL